MSGPNNPFDYEMERDPMERAKILVQVGLIMNGGGSDLFEHAVIVARAYIAIGTPVAVQKAPTLLTGAWLCGKCVESVQYGQQFCHMCGQPAKWRE